MGKCLNKGCEHNENGECNYYCTPAICPNSEIEHIPNYAEEQLEHAKEQENKKGHPISADSEEENMSYARLVNKNIEMKKLLDNQKTSIENYMKENDKLNENLKTKEMRIEFLECAAEKTKEKLENYELLKRMIKVLIEGL